MTILKTGEFKTYLFECCECGCIFTADSSEVLGYESVLAIPYPIMNCPWCKKKIVSGKETTEEELEELSKQLDEEDDDGPT